MHNFELQHVVLSLKIIQCVVRIFEGDGELIELAHCHLRHIGQQIIGYALWILANQAAGVCAYGVEIAQ